MNVLKFPERGPFAVTICREDEAWLVVCRQALAEDRRNRHGCV